MKIKKFWIIIFLLLLILIAYIKSNDKATGDEGIHTWRTK